MEYTPETLDQPTPPPILPQKKNTKLFWILGGVLVVLIVILAVLFGDFLGAKVIKKGSPRLSVVRGDTVTINISGKDSAKSRKLEICPEKAGMCHTLKYVVPPGETSAKVVIPRNFSAKQAVVITRVRDNSGQLLPGPPSNQVSLLVLGETSRPKAGGGQDSGGGGGGGSGGGGDGGGDSGARPPSVQLSQPYEPVASGAAYFILPLEGSQTVKGDPMRMAVDLYLDNVEAVNCRILIDGELAQDSRLNGPDFASNACGSPISPYEGGGIRSRFR